MSALEIRKGEQVALVGPNASGKSRLASAFAGRAGARYITFRDSYGSYGDRNYFMQQRWNLFTLEEEPPTAGEVLRKEAAAGDDPQAARRRLTELTALFGLEDVLDKPLVILSSGELRKFQLTRALLGGPSVLVIDNPFIGLDPRTRTLLTRLLAALAASTTLVLVLSRPAEIPSFITHVIPVRDGEAGEKVPLATEPGRFGHWSHRSTGGELCRAGPLPESWGFVGAAARYAGASSGDWCAQKQCFLTFR